MNTWESRVVRIGDLPFCMGDGSCWGVLSVLGGLGGLGGVGGWLEQTEEYVGVCAESVRREWAESVQCCSVCGSD